MSIVVREPGSHPMRGPRAGDGTTIGDLRLSGDLLPSGGAPAPAPAPTPRGRGAGRPSPAPPPARHGRRRSRLDGRVYGRQIEAVRRQAPSAPRRSPRVPSFGARRRRASAPGTVSPARSACLRAPLARARRRSAASRLARAALQAGDEHELGCRDARRGGIVRTQAMTMLPATPQRTAERRLLEPTPMIARRDDVGRRDRHAEVRGREDDRRRRRLGREAVDGSSFTTRWPIVLMIRQPPAAVPSEIAVAATQDDRQRDLEASGCTPADEQREGHDAHRLLGVVRAVAEGHEAPPTRLEPPEPVVQPLRVRVAEDVEQHDHEDEADRRSRGSARRRAAPGPSRRPRRT